MGFLLILLLLMVSGHCFEIAFDNFCKEEVLVQIFIKNKEFDNYMTERLWAGDRMHVTRDIDDNRTIELRIMNKTELGDIVCRFEWIILPSKLRKNEFDVMEEYSMYIDRTKNSTEMEISMWPRAPTDTITCSSSKHSRKCWLGQNTASTAQRQSVIGSHWVRFYVVELCADKKYEASSGGKKYKHPKGNSQ